MPPIHPLKNMAFLNILIKEIVTVGKGQDFFEGMIIKYGSNQFPDWLSVRNFFETKVVTGQT